MSKPTDELLVRGFEKGTASHPAVGFGIFRNLDISSNPGTVKLNFGMVKKSSTTVTSNAYWFDVDTAGVIYSGSDDGKVYKSTDAGATWAQLAGNAGTGAVTSGVVWKDYLIVKGATTGFDFYGPLSSSPGWHNGIIITIDISQNQTISPLFVSVDGNLYIGNGRYVDKLQEVGTFVYSSSSTYIYTSKAITLQSTYQVRSIQDLGSNLMLGTIPYGTNAVPNADIFPYPRSTLLLGLPIRIAGENGVSAMLTVGNRLYCIVPSGRIFVTDGVSAAMIARIPPYAVSTINAVWPKAIMYMDGKIFFGISTNGVANGGVWSYHLTYKTLCLENVISTANDGSVNTLQINALLPSPYLISWRDNASYGFDKQDTNYCGSGNLGSYTAYFDSPLYRLGEALANKTQAQLEYYLTRLLASGHGIKIQWRTSLDASFTTLGTYDFTSEGAVLTANKSAATMTNLVLLQLRVSLTSGGTASPELMALMMK
jgi:hypothetical protein